MLGGDVRAEVVVDRLVAVAAVGARAAVLAVLGPVALCRAEVESFAEAGLAAAGVVHGGVGQDVVRAGGTEVDALVAGAVDVDAVDQVVAGAVEHDPLGRVGHRETFDLPVGDPVEMQAVPAVADPAR